ncbi:MAG TPA: hypothetical protein PLV91_07240 [Verrucomicrobiota bacterium]|jgi:alpha-acetolactate decarboxylase|nr:hypothetical protein [Verrucomicrobiota bacterium]
MALLLGERTLKGRCVSVPHNQPEFELCKVEGDVIGLRLAYYLKEIDVPGAQRGGIRALKVEMTV